MLVYHWFSSKCHYWTATLQWPNTQGCIRLWPILSAQNKNEHEWMNLINHALFCLSIHLCTCSLCLIATKKKTLAECPGIMWPENCIMLELLRRRCPGPSSLWQSDVLNPVFHHNSAEVRSIRGTVCSWTPVDSSKPSVVSSALPFFHRCI